MTLPPVCRNSTCRFLFALSALSLLLLTSCGVGSAPSDSTATPQLNATPSAVNFGSVAVGSTSSQNVTLANTGSGSASISSASFSGPGFSVDGLSTPLTLSSSQSAMFAVGFAPTSAGTANGNISFKDSTGITVLNISMSGTGIVPASHTVDLTWQASTSVVAGYRVYRGVISGGPYSIITSELVAGTAYTDSTVISGSKYYYVVTAVTSGSQESAYSNQVSATIPLP